MNLLLFILFFNFTAFSYEGIEGTWELNSPRACLNRNKINDPFFDGAEKITTYQYKITGNILHLTIILEGRLDRPLNMDYNLHSLGSEGNAIFEARPIPPSH